MNTKIIQNFIGEINGVVIEKEVVFYSTEYLAEVFENKFNSITTENIKNISFAVDRIYGKTVLSQQEIEEDIETLIFNSKTVEEFEEKLKEKPGYIITEIILNIQGKFTAEELFLSLKHKMKNMFPDEKGNERLHLQKNRDPE